ncbi:CHAT domain-containing protein [Saprospira sp. CCB-QB6]|uniref:CHAT domain-containing protein n=1 Tax=Saprospira sp. CCB-QB6 TaxID=3023936 RepID=UPI002349179C|nr:CHAT domain-containing protein [Saprospira sp. CCB-QB6]WCL80742.1 CHAT domain-containing protein [Saprospira sp. CCB-QB6]
MKSLIPLLLFCLPLFGQAQTSPQELYEQIQETEEELSPLVDSYLGLSTSSPNYWAYADSLYYLLDALGELELTYNYCLTQAERAETLALKRHWKSWSCLPLINQDRAEEAAPVIQMLLADCPKDAADYDNLLLISANVHYLLENYEQAKKELVIARKLATLSKDQANLLEVLNLEGIIAYDDGHLAEAEAFLLEAIALSKALEEEKDASILMNLATIYEEMGQTTRALELYKEVLLIDEVYYGKDHYLYATDLDLLGVLEYGIGDYAAAEKHLLQAEKILRKTLGEGHRDYRRCINNLAALSESMGKEALTKQYYERLMQLERKYAQHIGDYALVLSNYAAFCKNEQNYQQARKLIVEATTLLEESGPLTHLFSVYDNYIQICLGQKDYAQAKEITAKLYQANLVKDADFFEGGYPLVKSAIVLLDVFESYGQIYQQLGEEEAIYLDSAAMYFDLALDYNRKIRQELSHEQDKQRNLYLGQRLINHQFQVALARKQPLANLLQLAEEQKAVLFQEEQQLGAWGVQLPDSILAKRANLEEEFMALKQQQARSLAAAAKKQLDVQIAQKELEIIALDKAIKMKFPAYFEQQLSSKLLDVSALQQQLAEDELLLEYFWSTHGLYAFAVTRAGIKLYELEKEGLLEDCMALQTEMQAYSQVLNKAEKSRERYLRLALSVSEKLIWPILEEQKASRLTLVLDGPMSYLPFEALLSKSVPLSTPYQSLPYLIKERELSYQSSAKLYLDYKQRPLYPYSKVLAFAGSYESSQEYSELRSPILQNRRSVLGPLPAAQKEVEYLEAFFDGRFLYGQAASEANFKRSQQEGYGLMHLALHGVLEKRQPFLSSLVFSETKDSTEDNFLEAWELAQLKVKTNLLVLSACETGAGEYQSGEGLLSLARAFQFAGSSSILASLWQVNDQSTAYIMQRFYLYLQNGASKSMALRQAKLDYLNGIESQSLGHPAYWSAFIQMGDPRPIPVAKKGKLADYWPYAVGGLLALSIPMGWFGRRKRKAA